MQRMGDDTNTIEVPSSSEDDIEPTMLVGVEVYNSLCYIYIDGPSVFDNQVTASACRTEFHVTSGHSWLPLPRNNDS